MILIECLIICIKLVIIIEYIKKVFVNQFYQELKFYFPMQFLFLWNIEFFSENIYYTIMLWICAECIRPCIFINPIVS